ncbi:hypothetical protein HY061_02895 [Candidatus Azambacteria bacterium]|nr:hypothetical protein [Candidatus Azambacteria bacterium]
MTFKAWNKENPTAVAMAKVKVFLDPTELHRLALIFLNEKSPGTVERIPDGFLSPRNIVIHKSYTEETFQRLKELYETYSFFTGISSNVTRGTTDEILDSCGPVLPIIQLPPALYVQPREPCVSGAAGQAYFFYGDPFGDNPFSNSPYEVTHGINDLGESTTVFDDLISAHEWGHTLYFGGKTNHGHTCDSGYLMSVCGFQGYSISPVQQEAFRIYHFELQPVDLVPPN